MSKMHDPRDVAQILVLPRDDVQLFMKHLAEDFKYRYGESFDWNMGAMGGSSCVGGIIHNAYDVRKIIFQIDFLTAIKAEGCGSLRSLVWVKVEEKEGEETIPTLMQKSCRAIGAFLHSFLLYGTEEVSLDFRIFEKRRELKKAKDLLGECERVRERIFAELKKLVQQKEQEEKK